MEYQMKRENDCRETIERYEEETFGGDDAEI